MLVSVLLIALVLSANGAPTSDDKDYDEEIVPVRGGMVFTSWGSMKGMKPRIAIGTLDNMNDKEIDPSSKEEETPNKSSKDNDSFNYFPIIFGLSPPLRRDSDTDDDPLPIFAVANSVSGGARSRTASVAVAYSGPIQTMGKRSRKAPPESSSDSSKL